MEPPCRYTSLPSGNCRDARVIWDEVVKAVSATTVTRGGETADTMISLTNFTRELDPRTLEVRSARTQDVTAPAQAPYVSPAPDTLAKYGFAVSGRDGTSYYAPDARTLISNAFLGGHCLHARIADSAHPGLLGVALERIPPGRVREIRGTLWIDAKTSKLQYLEYSYTGEPKSVPDSVAGGRVEFAARPSGAWIVRRWVIRMPKFARGYRNIGSGEYSIRGRADSVLAAVVEIGGAIRN